MKKNSVILVAIMLFTAVFLSGCSAIIDFKPMPTTDLDVYCDITTFELLEKNMPNQRDVRIFENANQLIEYLTNNNYHLSDMFESQLNDFSSDFFETNFLVMISAIESGHPLVLLELNNNQIVYHTYNTEEVDGVLEVYVTFIPVSKSDITNKLTYFFEYHEVSNKSLLKLEEQYR